MTLRVGLNLAYLVEDSGGSGTYARELIPEMLAAEPGLQLTAWIGTTAPAWLREQPWSGEVRWIRLPVPGVGSPWHLWHELIGIGLDARRRKVELVHGPAYLAPLIGVPMVATILDVIWAHHPEAAGRRFRLVMGTLAPLVGRRAARIIAISKAARDDISQTLHLDPAKFDVTELGIREPPPREPPDRAAVVARLGLGDEPIVLCVAAKRSHKNLHGLIRGFAQLPTPRPRLVLPGSPNEYETELREVAAELGVADAVSFLGWISGEDLEDLFAIARCFVLPTFQEGFGLPVLEAMARGVPVACSDIPVLREVASGAALMFDPHDPASIAGAIARLSSEEELRDELIALGRERVREFTWERTAKATLDSYRRALE
ncbi:MAG TPA: glycosyltransferase family 1 protein [Solirubrobacteraceae bacterium]